MAGDFDAGAGGLMGTNDLQQTIDKFGTAVSNLSSVVSQMGSDMGGGMTRHPAMGMMSEGQTFSRGSLNSMALGGNGSFLMPSQTRGSVVIGQGGTGTSGTPSSQPTMGSTAAGGGTNGGGATFGAPSGGTPAPGSGGSSTPATMGSTAAGGGANGGGATFGGSGGPGGPSGPIGGPGGPGGGTPSRAAMGAAAGGIASGVASYGMGQYGNQLLFNAYGQQMAATWGYGAQNAQNNAFGNSNGLVNAAAAGNAQGAASEFSTLNQMAGGGAIGYGNALQATNAFAFTNQGLGAAGGAQLASSVYNPVNSLRMQLLTGSGTINPNTGKMNSLSSIVGGLAGQGYLGGGSWNSSLGRFTSQKSLNASFTPGRGTSYMNLSALGNDPTQIQDIQSTISQANQAANKGNTSMQNVLNTMNNAEYGSESKIQTADAQLKKWGVNLSTIQKQGNQSSLGMAQSQSQSSTYNEAVSAATSVMTKFTQAVNYFLDKTGLNKAIGLGGGVSAGVSSSGLGGIVSGVEGIARTGIALATMGGGAASVSTAQSMTSQGSKPGNTTGNVSGQVSTAVRDAEAQVGKPYVYGGDTPQTSFDCSGLVMWAYDQAGVHLPRTSEQQWAALKNKSVPVGQVREGDIVFAAGSDGTAQSPGHEALMISSKQIVEAPFSGANIRIRAYNPNEWQHAGRPSGSAGGSGTTAISGTQTGNTASALGAGNSGAGLSGGDADLALTTNADSMLMSGGGGTGGGGGGTMSTGTNGGATTNNPASGMGTTSGTPNAVATLAKQMAARKGWTGSLWTDLDSLEMAEDGWNLTGKNPSSDAYGIAQFINGPGEYAKYGGNSSTAKGQVTGFLNYVQQRYKGPAAAWQHEQQYHWYGSGTGSAAPGLALVGDRGPELVDMGSGGQQVHNAQQTSAILRGNAAQTAQSPWSATPAQKLLLDTMTSANNYAQGSGAGAGAGGITVNVGGVTIQSRAGLNTSSDVQTLSQQFEQAVEKAIQKSGLVRAIRSGNTG